MLARLIECDLVGRTLRGSSAARSTSSRVTRPPGPDPETIARSMPRSFASFRTAGVAATEGRAGADAGDPSPPITSGRTDDAGDEEPAWRPPVPSPPTTSNVASGAPTASVSPAATWSLATRPANGEGISTIALAVSTSTSGWFSETSSPSADQPLHDLASSRPSPRSGSRKTRSAISVRHRPADGAARSARRSGGSAVRACAGGYGDVGAGDPRDRRLEVVERLLDDPRRDLGADPQRERRLVHDDRAPGRPDGVRRAPRRRAATSDRRSSTRRLDALLGEPRPPPEATAPPSRRTPRS